MTINTDVDIQNELPDSQDNDNNFIIVILVVIVCAILIIAGFFIVRLLMSKRQRKFIVEDAHDEAGTNANLSNRKGLQKQGSQPKMDDQYVVENLDYLELTKKHNRKQ